jgi:hypothetical protein
MAVVTATFQKSGSSKSPCKIGGRESGPEPCSQTPTYDTPATSGLQATAGMVATALSKGHKLEKEKSQQQKRQQQQDLCG